MLVTVVSEIGLSRPWDFGRDRAEMSRLPAVHPLKTVNDRPSLQATAGPDPQLPITNCHFQRHVSSPL
jgi:hypothetical protein